MHLFTVCGGSERVSLEIAGVLRKRGFSVTYITNSRGDLENCCELLEQPCDYEVLEVKSPWEHLFSLTGRFTRLRRLVLVNKALEKVSLVNSEKLVVDTSSNTPSSADIVYIHYPAILGTVESRSPEWVLYNAVVKHLAKHLRGKPRLILANSSWTGKLVEKLYGLEVRVLHPPVDVDYFAYDGRRKEKIIATISRLTPEKNLQLLPRIASKLPDYDWYLVGTTGTRAEEKTSRRVLVDVTREARKLNARNFHVLLNIPRRELRELLQRALFYVHPPFPEHFGIAVAEAMASGAIPLVYRDGGAWVDIVSPVCSELGYGNIDEVHTAIKRLENDQRKLEELKNKVVKYTIRFGINAFREKLVGYLDELFSK